MVLLAGVAAPAEGKVARVVLEGRPVAVFNIAGTLRAIDASCTHVGGPLDKGDVRDGTVSCPWHGSVFDLSTGAVQRGPAIKPVRAYRVTVEAGGLQLEPIATSGGPP